MRRNIRNYDVFKLSHQMVLKIYAATKTFPTDEKFALVSQLRRAAYSVPMNLVEGGARHGQGEFRRFVNIAIGSCAEVDYQLQLCRDLTYLSSEQYSDLLESYERIGKMLNRLMAKLVEK